MPPRGGRETGEYRCLVEGLDRDGEAANDGKQKALEA